MWLALNNEAVSACCVDRCNAVVYSWILQELTLKCNTLGPHSRTA
jgi:hypothetical protein